MPVQNTCVQCATPIPANAPQGLCPTCLLQAGLRAISIDSPNLRQTPKKQAPKTRTTVRDYELLEEIARGGMGIVFRARQLSLDRIVAVKALLFGEFASDPFIARFRAEAQAAAALQHPNIVAIHDVWQHNGQHFFSMEFVDGQTLAQILKEGPLPSKRAARYTATIARAVHYAHSRGILHRDLKPSNVLIDSSDQPRITDFGLAKRLSADAAQSVTGVVGSPHYMSPEQAGQRSGAQLGPTTDIYSIGAMLYHMLAARPPFVGETIEEVLAQTLRTEPISPRLLNASVRRDLETICLKCLQKDPRRRYSSAEELADDLDRFLQNKPICARPITPAERIVRWCRRNPAPTAVLVLLAIVAATSTWGSQHFRHLNQTIRIGQYVSDMNVAIRHAEDGDNGHALALLKAHVPNGKQADLRGFEWRHIWWLCRGNYENWLPTHPQIVGAIHYTIDGQKALTFAWDGKARLWDARARQNLLTITNVSAIGSFNPAETSFLINRPDGALQFLDAKTGATNQVLPLHGQLIAYSRPSQIAAILDTNNHLKIWNVAAGRELLTISNPPPAKTTFSWNSAAAISPDGSKLALMKPDFNPTHPTRAVDIWDLATGKSTPLPENRELRCLVFSPDSAWLLTGDGQGGVRRWNLQTREAKDIHDAHTVPILTIAFSPDGKTFATGSSDQHCIRLWDLATCEPIQGQFLGQAGDVWSLAFTPDGKQIASGTRDGIIRIWSVNPPKIRDELADLNTAEFGNVVFSPDSRLLAAGCSNRTVTVRNASNLEIVGTIPRANYVVAFSADNRRVLVSNHEWEAFWFDIEKRTSERLPNYGGKLSEVVSVAIAPDRRFAALGLSSGAIALIDMNTGMPAGPLLKGHSGPVQSVAFSPNGEKLASGGSDMNVMVWDVKSGASLGMCQEHKAAVYGLTISPNGKTLASGCGAETIKLWDVDHVKNHSWASASYHRSQIRSLSFSPDSRTLASGSEDRMVKFWNFAAFSQSTSRREVASFVFNAPLRAVIFSPDGNTLAAVTEKGELRLFRAYSLEECDKQLREIR